MVKQMVMTRNDNPMYYDPLASLIHKDLRTPKYKMRVVKDKKRKVKSGYRKHKRGSN